MEDVELIIIPTLSKAKISSKLSYPIGSEQISAALASVSQLSLLKLHFFSSRFSQVFRRGHYEFLRVEYLNNAIPADKWPVSSLFPRPPQYRWEIVVQPVPRIFRHRVKRYIIDAALPRIALWLVERTQLVQRGSDILAFFYDEKAEEFVPRQLTHLEPFRA